MKKNTINEIFLYILGLGGSIYLGFFIKTNFIEEFGIDFINDGFFIFMAVLVFLYILRRIIKQREVLKELNDILNFFNSLPKEDYEDKNIMYEKLVMEFGKINEKGNNIYRILNKIFGFYSSSISTNGVDGIKKYQQNIDAGDFFNGDSLLNEKINSKLYKYIPQLLVGLGLLGTFYGLSRGLATLNLANSSDMSQINQLIDKLKTSFYTSLYGMYFSIIFTVIMTIFLGEIEHKIVNLKNKLNLIFYDNSNIAFEKLREDIEEIKISNGEMATKIANSIDDGLGKYQKEIIDLLQNSVGKLSSGLSDTFETTINESMEKIFTSDFIEKFENIKNELIEVSEQNNTFIASYKEEIEKIVENSVKFKDEYIKTTDVMLDKFSNIQESLAQKIGEFNKIFNNSMDMYNKLNEFYEKNKLILVENNKLFYKFENISNQMNGFILTSQEVSTIWNEYKDTFVELKNNISESNKDYSNTLNKVSEEYGKLIDSRTLEYTKNINTGIVQLFSEYEENLIAVIDKFNGALKSFSNDLEKRYEEIEKIAMVAKTNNENANENKKLLEKLDKKVNPLIELLEENLGE